MKYGFFDDSNKEYVITTKPVESNVEEKGIKIPEFLQKRR